MNDNSMRQFLITKFVCAACGNLLTLSAKEVSPVAVDCGRNDGDNEPTGAAKVVSCIAIIPCETCLEPLQTAQKAFRDLSMLAVD